VDANPRFVAYTRVSTEGQRASGLGLEAQREMIRRHLDGVQGLLVEEYQETESGRKVDRPALARALETCRREGATLLIAKLDRLARNVHFISGLMESGVPFLACDMPTKDRFTLHIYAAIGEQEARRISENTRAALAARKAKGLPLGGAAHKTKWTERKASAWKQNSALGGEMIQRKSIEFAEGLRETVAPMVEKGLSLLAIASKLNAMGIGTPKGCLWNPGSVRRLLGVLKLSTPGQHPGKPAQVQKKSLAFAEVLKPVVSPWVEEGLSLEAMAGRLNELGYQTPRGSRWDRSQVQRVVQRLGIWDPAGHRAETFRPALHAILERVGMGVSREEIARQLNAMGEERPGGGQWNKTAVARVLRNARIDTHRPLLLTSEAIAQAEARRRELAGRKDP
jgi:DNA invertase Pin-like site-specific DNA recombinase